MCAGRGDAACCWQNWLAAVPDTLIANTTLWGVDIERHRRYFSFNTSSINQSHSQDVDTNYIYGSVLRRAEMRCALVKLQNALAALALAKVLTRRARSLARWLHPNARFLALSASLKFAQSKRTCSLAEGE
jgi:hypothetical protein